jgi:hypothetical protein
MKIPILVACLFAIMTTHPADLDSAGYPAPPRRYYLGFDRNNYPGDDALPALRKTFSFTSFWLNKPPSAASNTWTGKRQTIQAAGFGFVVLFNGKLDAELKAANAAELGSLDGAEAVRVARREGFPAATVIFLDQEEGGRLLPEQNAYLFAWVDAVTAGGFRAGVYCSGRPFREPDGTVVMTAEDIGSHAGGRKIVFWVAVDQCPPAPGCSFPEMPPNPNVSGVGFAEVWQYAQSPRRPQYTAACQATYNPDGNCYPPGLAGQVHVDVSTATYPDPSHGRDPHSPQGVK